MPDWTKSMEQTFEYYVVDPGTWKDTRRLTNVISSTINWDSDSDTLGSASFNVSDMLGECYVRTYLITVQNGVKEKHALGTFLVQTTPSSFNGKKQSSTSDAYTPLLELKENPLALGYSIPKNTNIMDIAYQLARDNMRAPVTRAISDEKLYSDFVASTNDNWLTFTKDLMLNAKYGYKLDELGHVYLAPKQDIAALQPVWTYSDDNSSILLPDINMDRDIYGIPNVVEITYSDTRKQFHARVVNDDPNSSLSTVNRGREITHREINPDFPGEPTYSQIKEYAERRLRELSSPEYVVTYTHGYCPTKVDNCVRLNYVRSGITDVKAKVISQSIKCVPGCPVTEKATFTTKLWR